MLFFAGLCKILYPALQDCARFYILLYRQVTKFFTLAKASGRAPSQVIGVFFFRFSRNTPHLYWALNTNIFENYLKIFQSYSSATHLWFLDLPSPGQNLAALAAAIRAAAIRKYFMTERKIFDLSWDEVGLWLRKKLDWLTGEHELIRVTLIINNLVSTCLHQ